MHNDQIYFLDGSYGQGGMSPYGQGGMSPYGQGGMSPYGSYNQYPNSNYNSGYNQNPYNRPGYNTYQSGYGGGYWGAGCKQNANIFTVFLSSVLALAICLLTV